MCWLFAPAQAFKAIAQKSAAPVNSEPLLVSTYLQKKRCTNNE
jgi:hypothetical protein